MYSQTNKEMENQSFNVSQIDGHTVNDMISHTLSKYNDLPLC